MAYSGRLRLKMAETSPFAKPRWARPDAARRTALVSSWYVNMRPLGPSIRAGLSANSSARRSTNGVSGISGMDTSEYGLRKIILRPPVFDRRRRDWKRNDGTERHVPGNHRDRRSDCPCRWCRYVRTSPGVRGGVFPPENPPAEVDCDRLR